MCPKSMKEPPDLIPTYQMIKMSLKRVALNDVVIEKLQEATKRANTIMTHGLHFLKLYLLHCYETGLPFPKLDKEFVKEVLKVPAKLGRPAGEKDASTKRVLRDLYDQHYKPYVRKEVPYTHLNMVIDYMAIEVITMYENNIKARFVDTWNVSLTCPGAKRMRSL
ncbi:unnamed protein product [Sphagnum jensenii]|uniref:Uncharacterized protein n=1 Tax=Sphagnum jensenii TaxID=128206 RepID=A0ABP1AV42_9BRYO